MKALLVVYGILMLLLTAFHGLFWRIFDWPETLRYMSANHRMLLQTYSLCAIPVFFFFGYAHIVFRDEILNTRLGRAVLLTNVLVLALRSLSDILFGDVRTPSGLFFCLLTGLLAALYALPLLLHPFQHALAAKSGATP